jgi:hypothetical protein
MESGIGNPAGDLFRGNDPVLGTRLNNGGKQFLSLMAVFFSLGA